MTDKLRHILVTGNLGYIGSVLVPILMQKGYAVTGYDTGFYGRDCFLYDVAAEPQYQIMKDIRDVNDDDVQNIDAIVHLAALSNDPLGELDPALTEAINLKGTMRLAELAKKAGVRRFIYSSSQSMYGISTVSDELDEEKSEKNPLTAYARTKWEAECGLNTLGNDDFIVVCFRPSTVFGKSPKLRCDIVYNNLLACAYTTGRLEIKSDGTPWRPVVHVNDVCAAFLAGLEAPREFVAGEAFNVGIPNGNFTVRQLADAVQQLVPMADILYTGEHGTDSRTYQVSFKKILSRLGDYFQPGWNLLSGGKAMLEKFESTHFTENDFRGLKTNRLIKLKRLLDAGDLNSRMRWNS